MVPSSAITIAADDERLACSGFSLGEPFRLGNFEIITYYFSSLSLSLRKGDSGTAFMGSTHCGESTLQWAMIEDSAEEFLMASCGDGGSSLPTPMTRRTGASLSVVATTPRMENAPTVQATMMAPPHMAASRMEAHGR
jgi:hypothetical protein